MHGEVVCFGLWKPLAELSFRVGWGGCLKANRERLGTQERTSGEVPEGGALVATSWGVQDVPVPVARLTQVPEGLLPIPVAGEEGGQQAGVGREDCPQSPAIGTTLGL